LPGASAGDVYDILADAVSLPRWWPSVYLAVTNLEPNDARGVGGLYELHTKGWLPYTLRWRFRVLEADRPRRIALEAQGDFVGRGVWTLGDGDGATSAEYDWRIAAAKPLLRRLTFLLRPIFAANHHWAMRRGEESLRLELARRRADTAEERARVPRPPPPTFARRP
jgi:hypothetical protein